MAERLTLNKQERQMLGSHVRSLREYTKTNQRTLAKHVNATPAKVSSIESGKTTGLEDGLLQRIFDHCGGGDVHAYVLGLRVRSTRESQGLSSIAVAGSSGTTSGFIEAVENGVLGRQLKFLGKTLDFLKAKQGDVLVKKLLGFPEETQQKKKKSEDEHVGNVSQDTSSPRTLVRDMQRAPCSLMVIESGALHTLEHDDELLSDLVRVLKAGHQRWYFVPIEEWNKRGNDFLERLELRFSSMRDIRNKLRIYGVTTDLFSRLKMNMYMSLDYGTVGAGVLTLGEDAHMLSRDVIGAGVCYIRDIAEEIDKKMKQEDNRYLVIECFHRFF